MLINPTTATWRSGSQQHPQLAQWPPTDGRSAARAGCSLQLPASWLPKPAQVSFYHRNLARQQQQVAQWLQKRRQENAQRRLAGEEALPEEDPVLFKPPPEPSPLDGFLIVSQARSCWASLCFACSVGCLSCCSLSSSCLMDCHRKVRPSLRGSLQPLGSAHWCAL